MHEVRARCSSSVKSAYPPGPSGIVVYLVGDIHGRLDLLLAAQERIDRDSRQYTTKEVTEVYLGDYIDRGPDSAAVVSRLIGRSGHTRTRFLRGNHEQLLLDFIDCGDRFDEWKAVGGAATLLSYGISPDLLKHGTVTEKVRSTLVDKVPEAHRAFYQATGSYLVIGSYVAVHAGLRPKVSLEKQVASDLLTIRGEFLDHTGDFGYIVVHGHTPVPAPDFRQNRINIDTGAFASNRLTCVRINEEGIGIVD